jgi:dynamin-binding protein
MDVAVAAPGSAEEPADAPRSLRVDAALASSCSSDAALPLLPSTPPPLRPHRSALRPTPRTLASQTSASSLTSSTPDTSQMASPSPSILHRPSFASFNGLLDSLHAEFGADPLTPPADRDTPKQTFMPDSPLASAFAADAGADDDATLTGTDPAPDPPAPKISKRTHALLELLSSERAYASDLALTRDIHIPLALGQSPSRLSVETPSLTPRAGKSAPYALPATPPSSGSSSRTLSTASDSSTASTLGPAMTPDDTRIIFGNIAEIAMFADAFSEQLEDALGSALDGGGATDDDRVGALFLDVVPQMEPLYTAYIRRHPTALAHLQALPPTPALTAYLAHTQTLASSLSHAWDLPSLLIKPVQRLLKYPLLLAAIIDETPDAHPDKPALRRAKEQAEAVAHEVNEGRRRYEIVQEVLRGKPPAPADLVPDSSPGGSGGTKKADAKRGKPGVSVPVGLAAAVALGKMKHLNLKAGAARPREGSAEAELCDAHARALRDAVAFMKAFARDALAWTHAVRRGMGALRLWAAGFARVIGLAVPEDAAQGVPPPTPESESESRRRGARSGSSTRSARSSRSTTGS